MAEYVKHTGGSHAGKSKKPYDAMVYKDADSGYTIAVDGNGNVIKKVLSSLNTDDVVINDVLKNKDIVYIFGSFNINSRILMKRVGSHLIGVGKTIISSTSPLSISVHAYDCIIRNITLYDSVGVYIVASGTLLEDIISYGLVRTGSAGAFKINSSDGGRKNITFNRCKVLECNCYGFLHEGTGHSIENVTYNNCEAINTTIVAVANGWETGWDLNEGAFTVDNIVLNDCIADGWWESGFHLESYEIGNIYFNRCTSKNNGVKPTPSYGSGFLLVGHNSVTGEGVICDSCVSENNKKYGFYTSYGNVMRNCISKDNIIEGFKPSDYCLLEGCIDIGSGLSFNIDSCDYTILKDCISYNSKEYGFSSNQSTNCDIDVTIKNAVGKNWDSTRPACRIASRSPYPANTHSRYKINIFDGPDSTYTSCVYVANIDNCDIEVYITTTASEGVYFRDVTHCKLSGTINIQPSSGSSEGVVFKSTSSDLNQVYVKDVNIIDTTGTLGYGIKNESVSGTKPNINNVTIIGATTNFSGCSDGKGTAATITAGNTTVDVAHNLATTPTKVRVTPTTNLGTRSFWVDTKGVATFRININSSDVIDHTFDWEAEV